MKLKVGVVGVTGYSGEVLVRILARHPRVKLTAAMARSVEEPTPIEKRFPDLAGRMDLKLIPLNEKELMHRCDLVFLALPHTESMSWVARLLKKGKRVIDLAGDFRLQDPDEFQAWYGKKHTEKACLGNAVYGLPEIYRDGIHKAKLIANPGCYATSIILAAAPLVGGGDLADTELIADSKSGITGAGREATTHFHFPEMDGNAWAYRVNRHAHQPEINQVLSHVGGGRVRITFTPQVIPVSRGILTTVYARVKRVKEDELLKTYRKFYEGHPFVRIREVGECPRLRDVVGTNFCDLSLTVTGEGDRVIILSALDNLVKGAGGQAVQNMNIMYGWNEMEGFR